MRRFSIAVVVALFGAMAPVGFSAVIDSFVSVTGPGLATPVSPGSYDVSDSDIYSRSEGNDDLQTNGWSGNFFDYKLRFAHTASIQILLHVQSGAADVSVSEYDVVFAPHFNDTADTWTSFKFELGFIDAGSFRSANGTELDFDSPDPGSYFRSSSHPQTSRSGSVLTFSGGQTQPGNAEQISFSIDVPGRAAIPAYAQTADGYEFALRATPLTASIPEPATGVALVAFAAFWIKSTRRSD